MYTHILEDIDSRIDMFAGTLHGCFISHHIRASAVLVNQICSFTLWWFNSSLLKIAIEIVSFPMKIGDFP